MRQPQIVEHLHHLASRDGIPLSGTFELSPICNFACRMCYVRKTAKEVQNHHRPAMTLEQWLAIAEQMHRQGTIFLLLTGGEPFLYPDFWPLYERLIDMGFAVSINSNGSLIDDEALERLKRRPPQRINITLYGGSDETYRRLCAVDGVFSRVRRTVKKLRAAGIYVKLNCSLTPENAGDLEEMVAFSKENDLILQFNTYMFPPLRRDEALVGRNQRFTPEQSAHYDLEIHRLQHTPEGHERYLKSIVAGAIEPPGLDEGCIDPVDGKVRCRAGTASWWITWDGYMTPCGMMPRPKADLYEHSFPDCWAATVAATQELRLSGICGACPNSNLCHSCAAMAVTETASFDGIPHYLCGKVAALRREAAERLSR